MNLTYIARVYSFRHKNVTRQNSTENYLAKVRGRYGGNAPVEGGGGRPQVWRQGGDFPPMKYTDIISIAKAV
jgi:hypothetical protein